MMQKYFIDGSIWSSVKLYLIRQLNFALGEQKSDLLVEIPTLRKSISIFIYLNSKYVVLFLSKAVYDTFLQS